MKSNERPGEYEGNCGLRVGVQAILLLSPLLVRGIICSLTKVELFSPHLLERGGQVSHEVRHRSEQVAKRISQRSKETTAMLKGSGQSAARALARRREQINSTLSDRGRKLTHKLQERDRETWMMIGVATGLVLVLIAAYLFIRNRIKQQMTHEEEPSILLQGDVKVPEEKPKKNSLAPMRKAKDLTEQGRLLDEL